MLVTVLAAAAASLAGCGKGSTSPSSGTASGSNPGTGTAGSAKPRSEYAPFVPEAARRDTPPPAMAEAALAVGAVAPAIDAASTRGRFVLADTLTRHAWVVLVLYRGDW